MAVFEVVSPSRVAFMAAISARVEMLRVRYGQYKVYRRTLSELEMLDARDLRDLGIGSGDIQRLAREAAGW